MTFPAGDDTLGSLQSLSHLIGIEARVTARILDVIPHGAGRTTEAHRHLRVRRIALRPRRLSPRPQAGVGTGAT